MELKPEDELPVGAEWEADGQRWLKLDSYYKVPFTLQPAYHLPVRLDGVSINTNHSVFRQGFDRTSDWDAEH